MTDLAYYVPRNNIKNEGIHITSQMCNVSAKWDYLMFATFLFSFAESLWGIGCIIVVPD